MSPIKDLSHYNTEMRKAMMDKIFFMDKIDAKNIFDFGCGNGDVIGFLSEVFPDHYYFGYDENPEMIGLAIDKPGSRGGFTSNFDKFLDIAKSTESKALVFNSVLHEVFSYKTHEEIDTIFGKIAEVGFDYIVIRDMFYDEKIILRPQSFNNDDSTYHIDRLASVFRKADQKMIANFENQIYDINDFSGDRKTSLTNEQDLIHFLLKYRYVENWDREVKENYFANNKNHGLIGHLGKFFTVPNKIIRYDEVMHENFIPPFIADTIKKDFGFVLNHNTHIKIILKKRTKGTV